MTKKPNIKVREYLLNILKNDEHYCNIENLKHKIKICGSCKDFIQGLALPVYYYNDDCMNFLLDCGYKKASPDMYWEVLARELQNIIDKNLI